MMGMMGMETLIGSGMSPDPVFGVGTDAFLSLLRLIGDPEAAKQRLENIYEAAMAANDKIREANEAQQKMADARKAHDETLLRERTEDVRSIAAAREKSNADCATAMNEVAAHRVSAEKLHAQARADATAAAELKADLERRLETIKKAAA
jgi:hypothetical protein